MATINRRDLFRASAFALASGAPSKAGPKQTPIDFRYSPLGWQTAICFPDDSSKTLVGECGEPRYGHRPGKGHNYFPLVIEFSVRGMEADHVVSQQLDAPGIPIVQTQIERPHAIVELTAFATRRPSEGRVDNVILKVRPPRGFIHMIPVVHVRTKRELVLSRADSVTLVHLDSAASPVLLMADLPIRAEDVGDGYRLSLRDQQAGTCPPFQCIFRLPQEGQDPARLVEGLRKREDLLGEARWFWRTRKPFQGSVDWKLPGEYGNFLTACARNILQAREQKDGKLTFQGGPTVNRGLRVMDGHFILESARYLGYHQQAHQGLEVTWAAQDQDGGISAGAGTERWRDTAIAMFSLVRQAELSQNWTYFRKMKPEILRGITFLAEFLEKAGNSKTESGPDGLPAEGSEFTNTLWVLAGLKAVVEAAKEQSLDGFAEAERFYRELGDSLLSAAKTEMRLHPAGFGYLPMATRDDPESAPADEWARLRPQAGQSALSHAIYPGLVFRKDDPVVQGHIALMQHCTNEEIPTETGRLAREGVWNSNAAFVAHVRNPSVMNFGV